MNNENLDQTFEVLSLFQFEKIILFIIGLAILIGTVNLLSRFSSSMEKSFSTRRLLISQIYTIISFILYIFGTTFLIYYVIAPPKELLIAVGGSIAVALGLSMKDLVSSIVAGVILLFDQPFQVGDRVEYDGVYGEIKTIGLRAVRLNTLDDNLITIPNSRFITDFVASANAGELDMMVTFDFHLALDADIRKAQDLLFEVIVTSRFVYIKKPIVMVLEEKEIARTLGIKLTAKAYVLDVRFEKSFQTDVFLRASEAFNTAQIKRPPINQTG